jgi:Fructosamine-3-kinase
MSFLLLVTSAGLFLPDNACYCGDRELDLAWLTTFSPNYDDFMQGYTEAWPYLKGMKADRSSMRYIHCWCNYIKILRWKHGFTTILR